ncbi:MAG: hypothetical protein ACTHON_10850 [Humibacter sp.]
MTVPGPLDDDATPGTMPPLPPAPADERSAQPSALSSAAEPSAPSSAAEPSAPKKKLTGLVLGLIGGGVLVLALLVAGGVWFGLETTAHTPQAAAQPFMQALVKGDVEGALRAGNIDDSSVLVTQKVYSQTKDHITAYSIARGTTATTTATVIVRYKLGGQHYSETLQLKNSGKDMLFFTRWVLEPVTLPRLAVAVDGPGSASVRVNNASIGIDPGGSTSLPVLPGRYDVVMATNADYSAPSKSTTVTSLTGSADSSAEAVTLAATLTDTGKKAATAAVNAWVAACISSPALQPAGCSFGLIDDYPDIQLSNQKWTLVTAPTFTIGAWSSHGWLVDTTSNGAATFLADASASDGSTGTFFSEAPVPVAVSGEITGFDASGNAIFTSVDWSGKASLPSA